MYTIKALSTADVVGRGYKTVSTVSVIKGVSVDALKEINKE